MALSTCELPLRTPSSSSEPLITPVCPLLTRHTPTAEACKPDSCEVPVWVRLLPRAEAVGVLGLALAMAQQQVQERTGGYLQVGAWQSAEWRAGGCRTWRA